MTTTEHQVVMAHVNKVIEQADGPDPEVMEAVYAWVFFGNAIEDNVNWLMLSADDVRKHWEQWIYPAITDLEFEMNDAGDDDA